MIQFLNLIRWKNLLMIALVQVLVKYALLLPFVNSHGLTITLKPFDFAILILATLLIAAGGYIINDIYDIETDHINRPDKVIINKYISEEKALMAFIILNVIGVGLGFYLSDGLGKSGLASVFVLASALLYIYSSYLKRLFLVGNIAISLVVALSILLVGIFEVLPSLAPSNRVVQITFFEIILDYAIFAFMINMIRELIKDIEDIDGDHQSGMQTLPIVLGRDRANYVAIGFATIALFSVVYYVITYLFKLPLVVAYFLVFIVAPLIYIILKLLNAKYKAHYVHISLILKLVMLTGMLSLLLYNFILK